MDSNAVYTGMAAKSQSGLGVVKETPLTRLSYAVDRLRKAEAEASSTADRLVGERGPEPTTDAAQAPIGSGLFGTIEELADNVSSLASQIAMSMQRIERRL